MLANWCLVTSSILVCLRIVEAIPRTFCLSFFTRFYHLLCRYNGYMRESMFSVGLQRIASSDVDRVKAIVDTTFDTVIE